jgi:type II secretory pathway pseudopilin PulG
MKTSITNAVHGDVGFTLVEMCVSMGIVGLASIAMWNVFWQVGKTYNETTLMSATSMQSSFAVDRMVYGVNGNSGLREANAGSVTTSSTSSNWTLSFNNTLSFTYSAASKTIVDQSGSCLGSNLVSSSISNTTRGCQISVSAAQSSGGRTLTNTVTTFVQYRN